MVAGATHGHSFNSFFVGVYVFMSAYTCMCVCMSLFLDGCVCVCVWCVCVCTRKREHVLGMPPPHPRTGTARRSCMAAVDPRSKHICHSPWECRSILLYCPRSSKPRPAAPKGAPKGAKARHRHRAAAMVVSPLALGGEGVDERRGESRPNLTVAGLIDCLESIVSRAPRRLSSNIKTSHPSPLTSTGFRAATRLVVTGRVSGG